ncbi:MAG TPA: hypothetical protein VI479_17300 [Blastocatellia bacterium]
MAQHTPRGRKLEFDEQVEKLINYTLAFNLAGASESFRSEEV